MQKVETKYHIITTNENDAPSYVCKGLCKKVYWKEKHQEVNPLMMLTCESCGGNLASINNDDYEVIEYKKTSQRTNQMTIQYMSQVKPEFVEYAKANWS